MAGRSGHTSGPQTPTLRWRSSSRIQRPPSWRAVSSQTYSDSSTPWTGPRIWQGFRRQPPLVRKNFSNTLQSTQHRKKGKPVNHGGVHSCKELSFFFIVCRFSYSILVNLSLDLLIDSNKSVNVEISIIIAYLYWWKRCRYTPILITLTRICPLVSVRHRHDSFIEAILTIYRAHYRSLFKS